MKAAGILFTAVVILSIAQSAVAALVIVLLLTLLWGVLFRPRETFGFLMFGVIMNLFEHHAGACIAVIGCLMVAAVIAGPPAPP